MKLTKKEFYNIVDIRKDLELGYELDMINSFLQDYDLDSHDIEDIKHEVADNFVEIYNKQLFELFAENLHLLDYHQQALDVGLITDNTDLITQLQTAQYEYNRSILSIICYELELD